VRLQHHAVARRFSALLGKQPQSCRWKVDSARAALSCKILSTMATLSCEIVRDDASYVSDASKKKKIKKECHCMQPGCKPSKPHTSQVACTWALLTQEDGDKPYKLRVERALRIHARHAIESATLPVCALARLVGVCLSGRVELCRSGCGCGRLDFYLQ
jgi:hypothetical protein